MLGCYIYFFFSPRKLFAHFFGAFLFQLLPDLYGGVGIQTLFEIFTRFIRLQVFFIGG